MEFLHPEPMIIQDSAYLEELATMPMFDGV